MSGSTGSFQLTLPGIREDNPRDFLAALGLFRLIDLRWPKLQAKLSWSDPPSSPVLSCNDALPDDWADVLLEALKELAQRPDKPLVHGDVIKTEYSRFRKAVKDAVLFVDSGHPLSRLPLLLYSSYSSQLEDEGGFIEPSGFSFGNGQSGKKLLLDVSQLMDLLCADTILKTLRGDATPVAAKSLRWSPAEHRPAAYRTHDPGAKHKGDETKDYPTLNVFAFFGLSFYPTVPTDQGGRTAGIHSQENERSFQWPIWVTPLGADVISTIVCSSTDAMNSAYGIDRVWKSRRFSSDKSLYFSPAEILS